MREIVASTKKDKPIIALIDLDESRGGMSFGQVRSSLVDAENLFAQWGAEWSDAPCGEALHAHLFASEAIEWNRIGHFQDVCA